MSKYTVTAQIHSIMRVDTEANNKREALHKVWNQLLENGVSVVSATAKEIVEPRDEPKTKNPVGR